MAEKTIEQRVKDIIVEQLGVNADQVTPEAKFIEDLGADPEFRHMVRPGLSELAWREFAHHLLYHFPHTVDHVIKYIEDLQQK